MGAVVNIYNTPPVYKHFVGYINLARHSDNTKTTYETGIRDFFRVIKNKEVEHLLWEDLIINKSDVEEFRTIIKAKGLSHSTINNKVIGLRRFYYELASNNIKEYKDLKIDIDFFKGLKKLPENVDSYDPFTVAEVETLAELAKLEQRKGLIKSKFIIFCMDTCIRKQAALNLKWSDFIFIENDEVKINVIDKGNKDYRTKIKRWYYDELLQIKTDSSYVFDLTLTEVDKMMPRLVKKLNISPDRNLTFHSIRKTGIDFKYRYTGDIKEAQKAANHTDASLTLKTYVTSQEYGVFGAYSLSKNEEENILNTLNHEQLMKLFQSLDTDLLLRVEKKAKELFSE